MTNRCFLNKQTLVLSGMGVTRWKIVQSSGRLGRDPAQKAIYITLVEKKNFVRGLFVKITVEIFSSILVV